MNGTGLISDLRPDTRVYVAGHRGLVGSAIVRALHTVGVTDVIGRSSSELDLRDRSATVDFITQMAPDIIILAAARVGGIAANSAEPVEFLSDNLRIQTNVMDAALAAKVQRFLFLGSSCIYPKFTDQPIRENSLLTGLLEPTNDAYAIAKIAGIIGVQAVRREYGLPWISAMPTNLYGPGDNFDAEASHLLPALIRRYRSAVHNGDSEVVNWGTGTPRRELLHVDDMASACLHLLTHFDGPVQVNVGTGTDHTIADIATMVAAATGFHGDTHWDDTRPDGTPRKLLDISTLTHTGWRSSITIDDGIADTVAWYERNLATVRTR